MTRAARDSGIDSMDESGISWPPLVPSLPPDLVARVHRLHRQIQEAVREQMATARGDKLYRVAGEGAGDISYGIDVPAEHAIVAAFADVPEPVIVVAEGLGERVFPAGAPAKLARFRVIIDPLDGTRELMYDKRSAFILSAIAPERANEATTQMDVVFGLITEVPPTIQGVGVQAWATRGGGAFEVRLDMATGTPTTAPARLQSSGAATIRHGFASFVRYFPGTHAPVGALADSVYAGVLGEPEEGKAACFDDCYVSSGGQLYLMASGRYRLLVDTRPIFDHGAPGRRSLCAHPYDLAGPVLVANEAGAIITDLAGDPLQFPLDTDTNCAFVAYANRAIQGEVEPVLQERLSHFDADGHLR
jgi:fructose-1,6-bisphosphatase/inositol monophosphatase family enzyme